MAFAETANLAVHLTLGGNFSSQLAKTRQGLRDFDRDSSRAYKAGAQIGTGIKRGAILAVAGIGALVGALAIAVKEGQDAANVQKVYARAIQNSGKVSADYVKILNAQQKALMNLGGVDDELIKAEQTRLIQMGLSGKATAALTPLILDASKATGRDLLTVTIAAGKAANGNATALQRLGIVVDKTRFKIDPLAETIRVLNQRFGGTTKALSGSFDVRLAALRENLKNIREEAGMKLLPSLTRIVDVVGTQLVPAFGQFVDRIMPSVISGLDQFSALLSNGGAAKGITAITDALGPMVELVKIAAAPVKAIVGAFLSMPKEVQTVLIGAFAVNKLTGGLVTNVAGGLVESIGKAFLGGVKAPLVNVTGGVVNVAGGGGLPGGLGGGAAAAGGAGVAVGTGAALGLIAASVAVSALAIADYRQKHEGQTPGQVFNGLTPADQQFAIKKGIFKPGQSAAASDLTEAASQLRNSAIDEHRSASSLREAASQLVKSSNRNFTFAKPGAAHNAAIGSQESASQLRNVGFAQSLIVKPTPVTTNVNVSVSVTAAGLVRTTTVHKRYGPAGGSAIDPRHAGYTPGGA